MRRTGLGRHGQLADAAGDPLDGLVNLFDLGIVLAVAFLIAGLTLSLDKNAQRPPSAVRAAPNPTRAATARGRALPNPSRTPKATGRGRAVGTVYRLPDGRLVYVTGRHP